MYDDEDDDCGCDCECSACGNCEEDDLDDYFGTDDLDDDGEGEDYDPSKPYVKLCGCDSNAFAIMGACRKAATKAGWTGDQWKDVQKEMMSGDYNHLLATAVKHFDVH